VHLDRIIAFMQAAVFLQISVPALLGLFPDPFQGRTVTVTW